MKLDRTRKLSEELLQKHPEAFGPDYDKNKKAIVDLTLIPSKQLRNHIAGYITRVRRGENEDAEADEDKPQGEEASE